MAGFRPAEAGHAMITVTDEVLNEMVRAIVREVDPQEIWLFGSYARGQAGPDSYLDILVVEREPFGPQRSRLAEITRVYDALRDFPLAVDVLIYSRVELEKWRDSLNHIAAQCLREGRRVYARH
jgi:predicted nucleotidyltransferase